MLHRVIDYLERIREKPRDRFERIKRDQVRLITNALVILGASETIRLVVLTAIESFSLQATDGEFVFRLTANTAGSLWYVLPMILLGVGVFLGGNLVYDHLQKVSVKKLTYQADREKELGAYSALRDQYYNLLNSDENVRAIAVAKLIVGQFPEQSRKDGEFLCTLAKNLGKNDIGQVHKLLGNQSSGYLADSETDDS